MLCSPFCSAGRKTAVDIDFCTRDISALVRGKEHGKLCDIRRVAEASERRGLQPLRLAFRRRVGEHFRVDASGQDRVDGDAVRPQLLCKAIGQPEQRRLDAL